MNPQSLDDILQLQGDVKTGSPGHAEKKNDAKGSSSLDDILGISKKKSGDTGSTSGGSPSLKDLINASDADKPLPTDANPESSAGPAQSQAVKTKEDESQKKIDSFQTDLDNAQSTLKDFYSRYKTAIEPELTKKPDSILPGQPPPLTDETLKNKVLNINDGNVVLFNDYRKSILGAIDKEESSNIAPLNVKYPIDKRTEKGSFIGPGMGSTPDTQTITGKAYDTERRAIQKEAQQKRDDFLKAYGLALNMKIPVNDWKNIDLKTIGRQKRELMGDDEDVAKDRRIELKGGKVNEEKQFYDEIGGLDVVNYKLTQELKKLEADKEKFGPSKNTTDRINDIVTKINNTENLKKNLFNKYPDFKKQQVANALSDQIYKDKNNFQTITGLYRISDDDVQSAARALGLRAEDIKDIKANDIKSANVFGQFVKSAIAQPFGEVRAGIGRNLFKALGGDADMVDSYYDRVKDNIGKVFADTPNAGTLFRSDTKVDTNPQSETFLQNTKNDKPGKFNWDLTAIMNSASDVTGQIIGMGKGTGLAGKGLQALNVVKDFDKARDAGMMAYAFITSYDSNYQQAKEAGMSEGKANAFSAIRSTITGLTEFIFPDYKITDKLFSSGSKSASKLISLIEREGTEGVTKQKLFPILLHAFKEGGTNTGKETFEEIADQASDYLISAMFQPSSVKDRDFLTEIKQTAITTALGSMLPVTIGDFKQKRSEGRVGKSLNYDVGLNPQNYIAQLFDEHDKGNLSQEELTGRLGTVQTLSKIVSGLDNITAKNGKPLSYNERLEYTSKQFKEALINKEIEKHKDDEVQQDILSKQKKETQAERKAVLENADGIDKNPDGDELFTDQTGIATDDKAKKVANKIAGEKDLSEKEVAFASENGDKVEQQLKKRVPEDKIAKAGDMLKNALKKNAPAPAVEPVTEANVIDKVLENVDQQSKKKGIAEMLSVVKSGVHTTDEGVGFLKDQSIDAPGAMTEQLKGNKDLVTDIIAMNTPERIQAQIKKFQDKLDDPQLDPVDLSDIDKNIDLLSAGLDKVNEKPNIEKKKEVQKSDATVKSAVIEINGVTYEGKNHAEAILKAKQAGEDISKVDRKADGKFKLSDGSIIDRAEAKSRFGADRAEMMLPQDDASDAANKAYEKITSKKEEKPTTQDGEKYKSAIGAHGKANEGDVFRMTTTSPSTKGHHGGLKDNMSVSQTNVVKVGDHFVEQDDLNKTEGKRKYLPSNLDKNNKEIVLTKLIEPKGGKNAVQEPKSAKEVLRNEGLRGKSELPGVGEANQPKVTTEENKVQQKLDEEINVTPEERESAVNNLIALKNDYNSIPGNHTKRLSEIMTQINNLASKIRVTVASGPVSNGRRTINVIDKDGNTIRRKAIKTDIGGVQLADRPEKFQNFFDKISDEILNVSKKGENKIDLTLSPTEAAKAVNDIREGKHNNTTNKLLNELEEMYNDGMVEFVAKAGKNNIKRTGVPVEFYEQFDNEVADAHDQLTEEEKQVFIDAGVTPMEVLSTIPEGWQPVDGFDVFPENIVEEIKNTIDEKLTDQSPAESTAKTDIQVPNDVKPSAETTKGKPVKESTPNVSQEAQNANDTGQNLEPSTTKNETTDTTSKRPGRERPNVTKPTEDGKQKPVRGAVEQQQIEFGTERPGGQVYPENAGTNGDRSQSERSQRSGLAGNNGGIRTVNYNVPEDYEAPKTFNKRLNYENNIAALKILATILEEKRAATPEEQSILAKYVGFGGLKEITLNPDDTNWKDADKKYQSQVKEMRDIIKQLDPDGTKRYLDDIRRSILNAHYTAFPVIRGIYGGLQHLGFEGGHILEPSAGIGNFISGMPLSVKENSKITAVELDGLTGEILRQLQPLTDVHIKGLQEASLPKNYYDLAISNVPFGDIPVYDQEFKDKEDKRYKVAAQSIHNYFFAKAFDLVRPGGIVSFVTSRYTLDSTQNKAVRELLADKGQFLAAVRLPDTSFKANAGTEVVTDVIIMRKYNEDELPIKNQPFLDSNKATVKDLDGKPFEFNYNEYFQANPGMVLGEIAATGSMYEAAGFNVMGDPNVDMQKAIEDALKSALPKDLYVEQQVKKNNNIKNRATEFAESDEYDKIGNIVIRNGIPYSVTGETYENTELDGRAWDLGINPNSIRHGSLSGYQEELMRNAGLKKTDFNNKVIVPVRVAKGDMPKYNGVVELRQNINKLLAQELNDSPDETLTETRDALKKAYNEFVKKYGNLNKADNIKVIKNDVDMFSILALEQKSGDGKWKPSDILFKRTISPIKPIEKAETVQDAILSSLQQFGRVNMDKISDMLGKPVDQIMQESQGIIFKQPNGSYATSDEYLTGNVKKKLAEAKAAGMAANVAALEAVQPEDIQATDIYTPLNARWIPLDHINDFFKDLFAHQGVKITYSKVKDEFSVDMRGSTPEYTKYGVSRRSAAWIAEHAINGIEPIVKYTVKEPGGNDKTYIDEADTQLARENYSKIRKAWDDFKYKDDARRNNISRVYNDTYNTTRLREYDGAHLTMPGFIPSAAIPSFRKHQKDAIWRFLQTQGGIADHIVGAGKTLVMVGYAMELRRLGLAKKPMIAGLKSQIPQLVKEFKQAYPLAKVLFPSEEDFAKKNRKRLLSQIATNDWDAIVLSHDQFGMIQQPVEIQIELINDLMDDIRSEIKNVNDKQEQKSLEKRLASYETKIQNLLDAKKDSDVLDFSQLGVDNLTIDESQEFKNLEFVTRKKNVRGLGNVAGSKKAFNMLIAARHIQKLNGGDKGVLFASGTPISNTMAELYLLFKYLRPSMLSEQGTHTFDQWASLYAEDYTDLEFYMGRFKEVSRFRKFVNLPELITSYREIADVKNGSNITLDRPKASHNLVKVQPTDGQLAYTKKLQEYIATKGVANAQELGLEKGFDEKKGVNPAYAVQATTFAKKISLDPRLIDKNAAPGSKIGEAADQIASIFNDSHSFKGTQLVFSDIGTPKSSSAINNIYDYLENAETSVSDMTDIFGENFHDRETKPSLTAIKEKIASVMNLETSDVDGMITEANRQEKFDVYNALKTDLIKRGVPPEQIAFIHDYEGRPKRLALYDKMNEGDIRILLGSTKKLGVGVNVQQRAIAAHHLDITWKPADLEQRNGRVERQGNWAAKNYNDNKVNMYYYATERSLDASMYELVNLKAKFIQQLKTGNIASRTMDDVGEGDVDMGQMAAELSGDPIFKEKATLTKRVKELELLDGKFKQNQFLLKDRINKNNNLIKSTSVAIEEFKNDEKVVEANVKKDKDGDYIYNVELNGDTYTKPGEAGKELHGILNTALLKYPVGKEFNIGTAYGFTIRGLISTKTLSSEKEAHIKIISPSGHTIFEGRPSPDNAVAGSYLRRQITDIPDHVVFLQKKIDLANRENGKYDEQLKEQWSHQEEFKAKQERLVEVDRQIRARLKLEEEEARKAATPVTDEVDQNNQEENVLREAPAVYQTSAGEKINYGPVPIGDNPLPALKKGEESYVEGRWRESGHINFTGSDKIESHQDVAFLMRNLETKGVEHAFVVHVDEHGKSNIQFLGMGNINSTIMDPKSIVAGVEKFNSKKIYIVHNHPSGNLTPSRADYSLTDDVMDGLKNFGVEVEHVIMDSYKGEYTLIGNVDRFASYHDRPLEGGGEKYKSFSYDEMEYIKKPSHQILNVSDAARYLNGIRFSPENKLGVILTNTRQEIVGNYILDENATKEDLVKQISLYGAKNTALNAIVYGNMPVTAELKDNLTYISSNLKKLSVSLQDYISVQSNPQLNENAANYTSFRDEGVGNIFERSMNEAGRYLKEADHNDNVETMKALKNLAFLQLQNHMTFEQFLKDVQDNYDYGKDLDEKRNIRLAYSAAEKLISTLDSRKKDPEKIKDIVSGETDETLKENLQQYVSEENSRHTYGKKADVNQKREELGAGKTIDRSVRHDTAVKIEAENLIKNGFDAESFANDIRERKPVEATDAHRVALTMYQADLGSKLRQVNRDIINTGLSQQQFNDAKVDRDMLQKKLRDASDASEILGTRASNLLHSFKIGVLEDDSYANMFVRKSDANGGAKLTDQQMEELQQQYDELAEKKKAYEDRIASLEHENATLAAEKILIQNARTAKKTKLESEKEAIKKDIASDFEKLRQQLRDQRSKLSANPIPVEMLPTIARIVKDLGRLGINKLESVVDNIFNELQDSFEELTKDDVLNAIGQHGYDDELRSKPELQAELHELKRTQRHLDELDNLENSPEPKTETGKRERNKKEKKAKEKVPGVEGKDKIDAARKETQDRISEINKMISEGNYNEGSPEKKKLDEESLKLRREYRRAKESFELSLLRDQDAQRSKAKKLWDGAVDLVGSARTFVTSLDFSAPLRQGIVASVAHPIIAGGAFVESFRQAFNKTRFEDWLDDIKDSPEYQLMYGSGLYLADPKNPIMAQKEERFMGNLIKHIPILRTLVGISERSFVSYLNKLRVDLFASGVRNLQANGITPENNMKAYSSLAKLVNTSTGRGEIGALEKISPELNTFLFSPRLMASRFNMLNPFWYAKLDNSSKSGKWYKGQRADAIFDFMKFVGFGTALLTLLKYGFGGDDDDDLKVGIDPTSTDFGKIIHKGTRWDIWGGFQPFVRLASQIFSGTATTSSGKKIDLYNPNYGADSGLDKTISFFRNKLAPIPAGVASLMAGKDPTGKKSTLSGEALKLITPLIVSDMVSAYLANGSIGLLTNGLPAVFGVGVQQYEVNKSLAVFGNTNQKEWKFLTNHGLDLPTVSARQVTVVDQQTHENREMTDKEFDKFVKARTDIIKSEVSKLIQKGISTKDENGDETITKADKISQNVLKDVLKKVYSSATKQAKVQLFGEQKTVKKSVKIAE